MRRIRLLTSHRTRGIEIVRQTVLRVLVLLCLTTCSGLVQACPNCKDGVAHYDATYGRAGASANGLSRGFNYSVVLMLTVPLGLIGSGGLYLRKLSKQGRLPEF